MLLQITSSEYLHIGCSESPGTSLERDWAFMMDERDMVNWCRLIFRT